MKSLNRHDIADGRRASVYSSTSDQASWRIFSTFSAVILIRVTVMNDLFYVLHDRTNPITISLT